MMGFTCWPPERPPTGLEPTPFSTPNLYQVAQGWIANLIGPDLSGHRVVSATVEAIGVLATWALTTTSSDPIRPPSCSRTMPFPLFFSITVFNNVTDPTVITLAILLLVRAANADRRGHAMTWGLLLGLGFEGYYGGRGVPIITVALLTGMVNTGKLRVLIAGWIGLWIAMAIVITALPLLLAYRHDRIPLADHFNQVSVLSIESFRNDPATALPMFAENTRDAAMVPWIGDTYFFDSRDVPFLGWPIDILQAIGIAAWVARAFQQRDLFASACLIAPWGLLASRIALTTQVGGHRHLLLTPFWSSRWARDCSQSGSTHVVPQVPAAH